MTIATVRHDGNTHSSLSMMVVDSTGGCGVDTVSSFSEFNMTHSISSHSFDTSCPIIHATRFKCIDMPDLKEEEEEEKT